MTFADAKSRFSSRVADYARYRPGYPPALLDLLRDECGLLPQHVIADVGSGTGLLAKLFLENGNRVFGIEPNPEMRSAGEEFLAKYADFRSLNASAEATALPDAGADFVTAGQAFHWFDPIAARREFTRILKTGGWVVIVWNDRGISESGFAREYENLLVQFGTDYRSVRESYPETHDMLNFFGGSAVVAGPQPGSSPRFQRRELPNFQEFDLEGLRGRLGSSSYAPQPGHANYDSMMNALGQLFDAHQQAGRVRMNYTTQIYFGRLPRT